MICWISRVGLDMWLWKLATPFNCNCEGHCDKPCTVSNFSPKKISDLDPKFQSTFQYIRWFRKLLTHIESHKDLRSPHICLGSKDCCVSLGALTPWKVNPEARGPGHGQWKGSGEVPRGAQQRSRDLHGELPEAVVCRGVIPCYIPQYINWKIYI